MTTAVEKIEKINSDKKKNGKYVFDPEKAGVSLNKQGQPTSKAWEIVTPDSRSQIK